MADAYLSYFFQTLGVALIACAVCWLCLPKAGLSGPAKRLLFAKLLGVFMALHFIAMGVVLGGVNVVVTGFATYVLVRWCWMPRTT